MSYQSWGGKMPEEIIDSDEVNKALLIVKSVEPKRKVQNVDQMTKKEE
jgi:hypothetical protein